MATLLRDLYHPFFFEDLCPVLRQIVPHFNERRFIHHVFDASWPDMTFKQRVRHIGDALRIYMPDDFKEAAPLIIAISRELARRGEEPQQLRYLFLQDYLARYGRDHIDVALSAIGEVTPFVSGEFALRPFLSSAPGQALAWLRVWTNSRDEVLTGLAQEGLRRLAIRPSAACRPPACRPDRCTDRSARLA